MRNIFFSSILILNINGLIFDSLDSASEEKEKIPYKFAVEPTLPEMVVFHIDEIVWPFKVDAVMTPPLRATRVKYQIRDRMGKLFDLFPEAGPILEDLSTHWYKVGGLLQSTDPEKIEKLMTLFNIEKYFKYFEMFPRTPGSKVKHITRLSVRAEVPFEDILYFDSNEEDLADINALNVTTVYVDPKVGITYKHIKDGFTKYYLAKNGTLPSHYENMGAKRVINPLDFQ